MASPRVDIFRGHGARRPLAASPRVCPLLLVAAAVASACVDTSAPSQDPPPVREALVEPGYPALDEACAGPITEPSHLVVTSTDFHTGAVGLLDLDTLTIAADLAPASYDAMPLAIDGRVFILNRYGFDYIDELDPRNALALVHEWGVVPGVGEASANPHSVVLEADGAHAWVPLHGAGELQRFAFPELQAARVHAEFALDLSRYADADGVPELSLALRCGEIVFVSAERIDRSSWVPASESLLIPVRIGPEPSLFEFDPDTPGPDAIALRGEGSGTWRLDPGDPAGHSLVLLNSGLERVQLASGAREWLVDEAVFQAAGYGRLQLSAFDFDSLGRIWVSAASEDFAEFRILRVALGDTPELIVEVDGLVSVTGAMEIADDIAWFADTTLGASGLRAFNLEAGAVTELPESPLVVGLPPMNLAPLSL